MHGYKLFIKINLPRLVQPVCEINSTGTLKYVTGSEQLNVSRRGRKTGIKLSVSLVTNRLHISKFRSIILHFSGQMGSN